MSANVWAVLIRREFWEHRLLWLAPLVLAALFILLCLVPGGFNPGNIDPSHASRVDTGSALLFMSVQIVFIAVLFALMSVVVFFYLSDCLYAERKDRSILFWKSLPVSDSATVLSKLLVALLVVPLGLYLLSVVTNLVAFGILFTRFRNHPVFGHFVHWDTVAWLRLNVLLIVDVLILALWYAPIAAYQLLMSAWARNSVFVWTILPPLVVLFGERLLFGTWNVATLLGQRLGLGFSAFGRPGPLTSSATATFGTDGVLQRIDALGLLTTADLWVGVAVAAGLVFAAIRIRRYRDDS